MSDSTSSQFDVSYLISTVDAHLHQCLPPARDSLLNSIPSLRDLSSGCILCGELLYIPCIIVGDSTLSEKSTASLANSDKGTQQVIIKEDVGCGHYFCYDCLNSWFERQSRQFHINSSSFPSSSSPSSSSSHSSSSSRSKFSCPLCRYEIKHKPVIFKWLRDTISEFLDNQQALYDSSVFSSLEEELFTYKTKVTEGYYNDLMQYNELFPNKGFSPHENNSNDNGNRNRHTDVESYSDSAIEGGFESNSETETETETETESGVESDQNGMFQDVLKDKKWIIYG